MKVTRRGFLISGAAVGGGLVLGFSLWPDAPLKLKAGDGEIILNGWVKINRDGTIVVVVPQAEMGQGVTTSLPMLLAEELDANFDDVKFEIAPVDGIYANVFMITEGGEGLPDYLKPLANWAGGKIASLMSVQATGGSTSIRQFYEPLRQAGAMARSVLLEAAARRLAVPLNSVRTENGHVIHLESNTSIPYGDLVDDASLLKPNKNVTLKDPVDFKIIGKSKPRLDIPAKVTGQAVFGLDVRLPDMLYASIRAVPTAGGRVESVDLSPLENNPHVVKSVVKDGFVAVVATHYWYAKTALDGLDIVFSQVPDISSAQLDEIYNNALADDSSEEAKGDVYREDGNMEELLENEGKWLKARYDVPFLAHACLEPMNCTVHVQADRCDIWCPTQSSGFTRSAAAKLLDIDKDNVEVHTTFLGGGFGRKIEIDCVSQAVEIAKEFDVPIQLIWSREEDTRHDVYRPKFAIDMAAYLGADNKVLALKTKGVSQSVESGFETRIFGGESPEDAPKDVASVEGIDNTPYAFPHIWVNHIGQKDVIPVGFWRSVGHSNNGFFMESFMDEVASETGLDPFDLRRQLLSHDARALKVLELLQDVSKWRGPQSNSFNNIQSGRGVALHFSFNTWVGQVADVVIENGAVRVEKVSLVVDCGQVVNPDTIRAQMESGLIYGLTAALYGDINIENGNVVESNFHDYEAVVMANCPEITTHIIADGHAIGGVGEPSTPPIAPAVVNAIFAATGKRIRELPIKNSGFNIFY
jgi:isoquinoline 1-oxidoreductase beta subunit